MTWVSVRIAFRTFFFVGGGCQDGSSGFIGFDAVLGCSRVWDLGFGKAF